jgi:hypothetical protein
VFVHQLAVSFDQRQKAGPEANRPPTSEPACDAFRVTKRLVSQNGFEVVKVPKPNGLAYSRADFLNEYSPPTRASAGSIFNIASTASPNSNR